MHAPTGVAAMLRELPYLAGYRYGPGFMSSFRKRWVVLRHPAADIRFGKGSYLGPGFSLHIPAGGSFIVGPGVEFRRGFRAEIEGTGRIVIGAGSVCTYSVLMQCTTSIEIGERCILAQSALVIDGQHRFRDIGTPLLDQGYDFAPIRIEDDVMVASKCTIMASIGRRSIVGANSVVTRPIPPYSVAVGAPARPIDYFGPDSEADR